MLGWLVIITGLAAFVLAAVTVTVLCVRAVRRRMRAAREQRSIRAAIRAIDHAAGEGLIRPDELKRYGDYLRANVEYPSGENGHEDKGAA